MQKRARLDIHRVVLVTRQGEHGDAKLRLQPQQVEVEVEEARVPREVSLKKIDIDAAA